jgi:hypothetical protein
MLYGNHTDTQRAHLDAQRFQILERSRLRRAVRAGPGQTAHASDAGDPNQRAFLRGNHRGGERLEGGDHAEVVDIHHFAEGAQIAVPGDRAAADAGIGDHDIRQTVLRDELRGRFGERFRVADVDGIDEDGILRMGLLESGEGVTAAGNQAESRAAPRIFGGEREADATRGAGNENLQG